MMINPQSFVDELMDKSYEELIKEKDKLINKIKRFENKKVTENEYDINPSPDVIYQCNLLYLSELSKLINDKFNKKLWEDENE